jgi:general secretion pathway protein L
MYTPLNWQWFPSEWVSWHRVRLPPTRHWKSLLPFALEEKLASPIDQLLVIPIVAPKAKEEAVALVVNRQAWQAWLEQQKSLGRSRIAVCPDVLALPYQVDHITLVLEDHRGRMRWEQWQGMAGSITHLEAVLHRLMTLSPHLTLICYGKQIPDDWLQQGWKIQTHSLDSFTALVPSVDMQANSHSAWNWQSLGQWRTPAILAMICLALAMMNLVWDTWQKQHQAESYRSMSLVQFRAAFPEIKRQVNLLSQARNSLKQAQGHGKTASLYEAMSLMSEFLLTFPPVNQLSWKVSQLSLVWESPQDITRQPTQLTAGWSWRWTSDRSALLTYQQQEP